MADRSFNPGDPIAFFITWTTYGSWLPGDARGWWRKGDGARHSSDAMIQGMAYSEMRESAFKLSQPDQIIVRVTIERHCKIRGWTLHAVSVRTNHAHVVVAALGYAPETVRDQFKAWCTRKLKPKHPGRKRFWTEGASCRSINHEEDLDAAVIYTTEAQDRKVRVT